MNLFFSQLKTICQKVPVITELCSAYCILSLMANQYRYKFGPTSHPRSLNHNSFGNNATINQGDIHYNIALDYAYRRYEYKTCSVFWVHADSKATFIHDYKTIANKLGIEQAAAADGKDLLRSVRNGIEACPSWVLILDNVDILELFGVGLSTDEATNSLYKYVPNGPTGTILWTSRDARIAGTLVGAQRGVEVPSMERDEAIELLNKMRSEEARVEEFDDDIEILLEELQRFPLAISQAGAYMRRMRMTAAGYLSLLRESKRRWDTLKTTEFDRHRRPEMPNSVLDTWTVSMERIQSENRTAYQISKCSNEDPTKELELEVTSAIMRLQEFSFLRTRHIEDGGPSYEMHKLVQEAARYRLAMRGLQNVPGQEIPMKTEASDEVYYTRIALQALSELFPASKPESWGQCERYLAHAVGMGDWAEISHREADTSELLSRASGLASISAVYHYQGDCAKAKPLKMEALAIQREVLGEKHPSVLWNIGSLAATCQGLGEYKEAKALYQETLDLRRETLGENHPDTPRSITQLGAIYHDLRKYKLAESLAREALKLEQKMLGEEHPYTLQSKHNLAIALRSRGDSGNALSFMQESSIYTGF
ncbi:hypothetical protein N5P37_011525 [Trichoderma harzianum]|nr:hypothetical protein N5P37_011525 [Trichoderma harzianum]